MLGLNPTEQEMVDIPNQIARYNRMMIVLTISLLCLSSRKGLIFFPDFCQLCLEKFRENEEEEEEFYKLAFKVFISNSQTDSHSFISSDHLRNGSFSYRFPSKEIQIKQTFHHQERLPAHHEEFARSCLRGGHRGNVQLLGQKQRREIVIQGIRGIFTFDMKLKIFR